MSKRESTLKEVESSTKELRELLDQHRITGASLQPSDDVKVCWTLYRQSSSCPGLTTELGGSGGHCGPVFVVPLSLSSG